jgi:hypothetical protein
VVVVSAHAGSATGIANAAATANMLKYLRMI